MKDWPLWEVFVRSKGGLSHRHVGSVHAPDAEIAVRHARDTYTRRMEGVSLWVVPSAQITTSDPAEDGPMFEPAEATLYRHPTFYTIPSISDARRVGKAAVSTCRSLWSPSP